MTKKYEFDETLIRQLVEKVREVLQGQPHQVIGSVLGTATAAWLSGYSDLIRAAVMEAHVDAVRECMERNCEGEPERLQ